MKSSAYIMQLEAKDLLTTLEIKNKKRYSASFDYSLDFIQLQKLNNTAFYYDNEKDHNGNEILKWKDEYNNLIRRFYR